MQQTDPNVYIEGDVRVEFVELGEGINGDYNPYDPDDVELLRCDVYLRADPEREEYWDNDGGFIDEATGIAWASVRDGSFCTNVPVSATDTQRHDLLQLIHAHIGDPPNKLAMGEASWFGLDKLV